MRRGSFIVIVFSFFTKKSFPWATGLPPNDLGQMMASRCLVFPLSQNHPHNIVGSTSFDPCAGCPLDMVRVGQRTFFKDVICPFLFSVVAPLHIYVCSFSSLQLTLSPIWKRLIETNIPDDCSRYHPVLDLISNLNHFPWCQFATVAREEGDVVSRRLWILGAHFRFPA